MSRLLKKGKLYIALILTAAMLIMSLSACGSSSSSDAEDADSSADSSDDTSDSEELKVLRIAANGATGYPMLELGNLALDAGYLEEELNAVGYTIEWYIFTSGTEVNEALASGEVDAAIYGDFPAFTSKSSGLDVTVVATTNQRVQYGILSTGEISSPSDFEGKTVVFVLGSIQQYFWEKYVEVTGIDGDAIEVVGSTDFASLLTTGSADAAPGNLYLEVYMESLGIGTVVEYGSDYDIYTTFVVNATNDLLEESPEAAVAINKALIRAYEDAVEDPELLYEAVATETYSVDVMRVQYEWDETLWYLDPEISDETFEYYEELNEWMYENGLISETVDIDSFIDTSYYYQALEELEAEE